MPEGWKSYPFWTEPPGHVDLNSEYLTPFRVITFGRRQSIKSRFLKISSVESQWKAACPSNFFCNHSLIVNDSEPTAANVKSCLVSVIKLRSRT